MRYLVVKQPENSMAKRKKQPYNGGGRDLTLDEKLDWVIKGKEVKCTMMTGGGARRATTPPFKVQYRKLKANHKDEWVPAERTLERWCFVQSKDGTKGLRTKYKGRKCEFNSSHQASIDTSLSKDPYTTNSELAEHIGVKDRRTAKK